MKKWYDEEYEWEIEVAGFLRGQQTEHYCRNGEEIGDKYTCTLWLSSKRGWPRYLFKGNADNVSYHGSCQKRR